MKKLLLLLITLSLCAAEPVLEIPAQYQKSLLNSTNKYQFATNELTKLYKSNPGLAYNLTVISGEIDKPNKDKYFSLYRKTFYPAKLTGPMVTVTTKTNLPPIQLQSYGGADPLRP